MLSRVRSSAHISTGLPDNIVTHCSVAGYVFSVMNGHVCNHPTPGCRHVMHRDECPITLSADPTYDSYPTDVSVVQ